MGRPKLPTAVKEARGTFRRHREATAAAKPRRRTKQASTGPRDYVGEARRYVDDVLTGRIVASKWVRLACERQRRDLARAADGTWLYVWDSAKAIEACQFLERLPHVEGKWATPTIRLEPWQCFVVSTLFGWRHRADLARRRFSTMYLETGRKSAKSTIAAGLTLFHVVHEQEPGASVVFGATTGSQARICFEIAARMVRRAEWLRDAGLRAFANAITLEDTGATMKPVNAKASSLDGLNPSCIVLDESHAQDFELHDVLKSSQGARPNPLLLCPTTAGYDLLSVGYALRQTLEKVLEQIFDADHFFGAIYSLDEGDAWNDSAVWVKANPSIGITPTREWVAKYCTDAEQTPSLRGEFETKVCSRWLQSASTWLSMTAWDKCADPALQLSQFEKQRCWIGCDLASRDDLAAVAYLFERDGMLIVFVTCYLPELVVAERARAVPAYLQWVDRQLLVLTDGDLTDHGRIEQDLRAAAKRFDVQDICFDQYGSVQISGSLAGAGLPARVEAKSAKTFTGPSQELEVRITRGRFRHDGNSLLKWAASNACVTRRTDDSLLPKKATAESPNKIDPLDATLLAIGGWLRQPKAQKPNLNVYFVTAGSR